MERSQYRQPVVRTRKGKTGFQVIYYEGDQRRYHTCATEDEAHLFVARLLQPRDRQLLALTEPLAVEVLTGDLYLAFRAFLATRKELLNPKSYRNYGEFLLAFLRTQPQGIRPSAVSVATAELYLLELLRRGLAPASVNTHRIHLRACWSWMVERGLVRENVWQKVRPCRVDPRPPALVPPDQVAAYLDACDATFKAHAALAIYAGLRRREVLELTWFNVDLKRGTILVTQSKSHRPRRVPIHADLRAILEALPRASELVVPRHTGTWYARAARRAGRAIGIERVTFHGLRATCATLLASAGVGETAIRDILGHHDTAVTRVYLGLQVPELQAAMDRVTVRR